MVRTMSWILLFTVVITILAGASSWTGVQISTCNAPIRGERASFCCFTSNLPTGASIYFSKNSQHVIRISQSCEQLLISSNDIINLTCSNTGPHSNYSIALSEAYTDLVINNTWECGFYGNKSKMVVKDGTILDGHRYLRQDAGSNGTLYTGNVSSSLVVRMYKVEDPSRTLLLIGNNSPTVNVPWLLYKMNNSDNMYYVDITNILYSYNGTYVFEKLAENGHETRSGVTLVVNKIPSMPSINASTNWKLADNKAIGSIVCVSYSQSAAPLYYTPEIETLWRLPGQADWTTDVSKYTATVINNTVNIANVDCNKPTLPIYCSVIDGPFKSLFSQGFDPHSMCDVLGYKKPQPFIGDPTYRSFVIVVCILVTSTVFTFVITTVVARHFLKKKGKRLGRKCKRCCVCCAELMPSSSDSDSDSDYQEARANSRRDRNGNRNRRDRSRASNFLDLADGLDTSNRDSTMERALAQIAIEESRLQQQIQQAPDGADNPDAQIDIVDDASLDVQVGEQGAVGGVALPSPQLDDAKQQLVEVETLLSNHNSHLNREPVRIRVDRKNIVDNLLNYYCEEYVALSQVHVQMIGEEGLDYGGVAYDMYTTFWYRVQEDYFLGSDRVVPDLLPHKMADEHKYRILGRILSHSIAVLKSFPLPMCKSAIIAMIFETTDVSQETILEDFLYFLDEVDRRLVTTAIGGFSNLTNDEKTELGTIFVRYDYAVLLTEGNFFQHLTQLARHVVCVRPKTLLDKMRSGIPQVHMEHFWSFLHQDLLTILFQALQPTPSRVIARLKTEDGHVAHGRQERVLNYLKDFLKETSQIELETFLVFVTGKKSMPRQPLTIAFTTERGVLRTPRAHTCSSMMELPETYESYETFRSEFKHLLASDEAQAMTMA